MEFEALQQKFNGNDNSFLGMSMFREKVIVFFKFHRKIEMSNKYLKFHSNKLEYANKKLMKH